MPTPARRGEGGPSLTPLDALPSQLSGTVLVVEDSPVNRVIAGEMLQSPGPLDPVQGRRTAWKRSTMARRSVDLGADGLQMPVMDGYTAARHIRARER